MRIEFSEGGWRAPRGAPRRAKQHIKRPFLRLQMLWNM